MGLSLYLSVVLICIFQVGDTDSISGHSLETCVPQFEKFLLRSFT